MPAYEPETNSNSSLRQHAILLPRDPPDPNVETAFRHHAESLRTVSRKRRAPRKRASTACQRCRIKKLKCEGRPICTYCQKYGAECTYQTWTTPASVPSTAFLLERIAALEEKLEGLSSESQPLRSPEQSIQESDTVPTTGDENGNHQELYLTPSSSGLPSNPIDTSPIPITDVLGHHNIFRSDQVVSQNIHESPYTHESRDASPAGPESEGNNATSTPFERFDLHDTADILPLMELYLELVCPLFPMICDVYLWEAASTVVATGFKNDLYSCMVSFVMLLAKAYSSSSVDPDESSVFSETVHRLSSLPVQLTLDYAHTQVLCSLFLLKRHRLLEAWHWLHAGCTTLYTVIKWEETRNLYKTDVEKNTILRTYWICHNLERDLTSEIDVLPSSRLSELEDQMPLPLGCDEASLSHLEKTRRIKYLFFLADTSLRSILARIDGMCSEFKASPVSSQWPGNVALSPVAVELKSQLAAWDKNVPPSLDWSPCPSENIPSLIRTRLRLLYWLAQFRLGEPVVIAVVGNTRAEFNIDVWSSLMHGLSSGYTLARTLVREGVQIDAIMGKRVLAAISLLEKTLDKSSLQQLQPSDSREILECGRRLLKEQLKGASGTWPWEIT
ncbi:hypothetical protein ABEF92_000814 [Exophiala dermatitidis]|uniref:Zn(2)-C6 fungal-type domain-containing protein n=1 Tax=Exophiala dermatitidis (strain ATCC 34100 / CBS 525.76 / NIH/UT8656) TaxID=858893 RepID=H6C9F8_EXODN|nr:uncharacterized protein HMPREF1120_07846 [Exophiala dermatitidis NIH/UT8656]EHY59867.1 hypothetical protein HMPREF1120_07846 [Exophiala dermatitidis NIH/UT8656]